MGLYTTNRQDLEILRGYVPGFNHVLGHEFVGIVESCPSRYARHAGRCWHNDPQAGTGGQAGGWGDQLPRRWVHARRPHHGPQPRPRPNRARVRTHRPPWANDDLAHSIIGRDGTMAQWCRLPAENLFEVPDSITDKEAAFAEPLAAACRVVEQQVRLPAVNTENTTIVAGDCRRKRCRSHRRRQAGVAGRAGAGVAGFPTRLAGCALWTPCHQDGARGRLCEHARGHRGHCSHTC